MLKVIELLHRWTGGLIGLLLAILGLSGAILVHESAWILLPHADDPPVHDVAQLGATVTKIMSDPATKSESIIFASDDFGLLQLRLGEHAGAYADASGAHRHPLGQQSGTGSSCGYSTCTIIC